MFENDRDLNDRLQNDFSFLRLEKAQVNLDALTSKICETATDAKGKPSLYIKLRERGQQTSR